MKCQELLKMLNDYVDGDVDPATCEGFEKHLEGCNPCQIVVDSIRKTITLYRKEGACEIPIKFRDKLHKALRERWREKRGSCGP
jgi:anti-sigma factor RsiW